MNAGGQGCKSRGCIALFLGGPPVSSHTARSLLRSSVLEQSGPPTVTIPGLQVSISSTAEPSFEDQNSFSNAYNTWFNGQTQWLPAGQQAIGAALQRAALPPMLVLKLVYPSQPTGSSINPWTQFPYTAIGTGALGAIAGAVTDFGYVVSEIAAAETSTETLAATMSLGGALLEGGALGGTLGLGVGAIAGVAIAGGIYAYEPRRPPRTPPPVARSNSST